MDEPNGGPRTALVTGGGSGIGRAVALGLAAAGFAVGVAGRRREPLEAVAEDAARRGLSITPCPADVSSSESVNELFEQVSRHLGRLDLLFNNAGQSLPAVPLEEVT